MSIHDSHEDAIFTEQDEDYYDDVATVTCNRCGATGLTWVDTGVRMALTDDTGLHVCHKATLDDFEDLS